MIIDRSLRHRAVYAEYQAARKALESDARYSELRTLAARLRELPAGPAADDLRAQHERLFRQIERPLGYMRSCTRLGQAIAEGFVRPDGKKRRRAAPAE